MLVEDGDMFGEVEGAKNPANMLQNVLKLEN